MAAKTIIEALTDDRLLGSSFEDRESWARWFVLLRAIFALPMSKADLATFKMLTGRDRPDPQGYREAWLCIGRRAGKSRIISAIAVYLACFIDWSANLAHGELAHVLLCARDRQQAKTLQNYILGMLENSPLLSRMIVNVGMDGIELTGNVQISVFTSDYRSIRGRTVAVALLDEVSFWPQDSNSASPDVEILNALRPAMMTLPNSRLFAASSPYARTGVMWQAWDEHWGKNSDVLVAQAATRTMNATISEAEIEKAIKRNPAMRSEYYAQFREDCEQFVSLDTVRACTGGYLERGFDSSKSYHAFLDPSGGRSDAMSLAIGHREGDQMHIDLVWAKRAPFNPNQAVDEIAQILKTYKVSQVFGDAYGGDVWKSMLQRYGRTYTLIKKVRTELYRDMLPLLNSQSVTLPNNPELIQQLVGLERTICAGREKIDHPRNGHDDLANAAAGCCELLARAGIQCVAQFGTYSAAVPYHRPPSRFDGLIQEGPLAGGHAVSR